jgi:hypothetical protein
VAACSKGVKGRQPDNSGTDGESLHDPKMTQCGLEQGFVWIGAQFVSFVEASITMSTHGLTGLVVNVNVPFA